MDTTMNRRFWFLVGALVMTLFAAAVLAQEPVVPPAAAAVPLTSNAQVWISAIGALATVAVAYLGFLVSVKNSKKSDAIETKVDQVHTLTNSNMTALNAKLDAALAEVKAGKDMIAQLRLERSDTASAQAASNIREALATPVPVRSSKADDRLLESIEKNTADTAANTAPPEKDV